MAKKKGDEARDEIRVPPQGPGAGTRTSITSRSIVAGPRRGMPGRSATPCTIRSGRSWGSRRSGPGSRTDQASPPRSDSRRAPRARSTSSRSRSWTPSPRSGGGSRWCDCTLDKLHEHIQTAMGWTNSHLHHFRIDGQLYGDPMLMAENFEELKYKDSTTTMLSDILPEGGERFRFEYEYDFGDGWSTRSSSRAVCGRAGEAVSALPGGRGPARPRTWAASGGTRTSSRPSPTPRTSSTTSCGSGSAGSSTPRRSARWRRPGG